MNTYGVIILCVLMVGCCRCPPQEIKQLSEEEIRSREYNAHARLIGIETLHNDQGHPYVFIEIEPIRNHMAEMTALEFRFCNLHPELSWSIGRIGGFSTTLVIRFDQDHNIWEGDEINLKRRVFNVEKRPHLSYEETVRLDIVPPRGQVVKRITRETLDRAMAQALATNHFREGMSSSHSWGEVLRLIDPASDDPAGPVWFTLTAEWSGVVLSNKVEWLHHKPDLSNQGGF